MPMKRILLIFFAILIINSFNVSAQEALPDFSEIIFTKTGAEGKLNLYSVNHGGAVDVTAMLEGEPGDYEKETIRIFGNEILSWKGLEIKSIKLIFKKDAVEINVIPVSLKYNETDFTPFLPAGLTFIHTHYTMYDFRLVKDNYFIRVRGQYYSQALLLEKMEEAVADPAKYIAVHDPEFMVRQIADNNLKDTKQDGEISGLKKELEELTIRHRKLLEDFEKLRYAYVAVTKNGIYGRKIPIPQADIDAVIAVKESKPGATVEEVYAEVTAKGKKITKGKVALILNTYFGSY